MAKKRTGVVTVDVLEDTHKKLAKIAINRRTSIRQMVNHLLIRDIAMLEEAELEFPYLKNVGEDSNVMYVKDARKTGNIFEVEVKNRRLYCRMDESEECVHCKYVYCLPETGQLYLENPNSDL